MPDAMGNMTPDERQRYAIALRGRQQPMAVTGGQMLPPVNATASQMAFDPTQRPAIPGWNNWQQGLPDMSQVNGGGDWSQALTNAQQRSGQISGGGDWSQALQKYPRRQTSVRSF